MFDGKIYAICSIFRHHHFDENYVFIIYIALYVVLISELTSFKKVERKNECHVSTFITQKYDRDKCNTKLSMKM